MKTLVLKASPKKDGNTATMADRFSAGLRDADIAEFHLNDLTIHPCQACNRCLQPPYSGCVLDDDFMTIYPKFRDADLIVFSPEGDEVFFTMNTSAESADLMWMRMVDGVWTKPQPAPFNSVQIDNDICISLDGQRLCWRSWRPLPGNTAPEKCPSLWTADRTADGCSEAFPIECGGEIQLAWYPSIAGNGTLYFSARKSPDEYCVYQAKRRGNTYEEREPIICGMESGGDLCIAPDESFLVVTCFSLPHFKGKGKLHMSFRTSPGEWTPLQDMGALFNTELIEYCPTISADGRRLFFCRLDREAKHASTYWIDADVIKAFRPTP